MARVLATGPSGPSAAARLGGTLGQAIGTVGGGELARNRMERQAIEESDPFRKALQSILIENGAMNPGALQSVNQQVQQNPLQFALGGGQPQQPPTPQPSGQGTDAQQLLARIQSDPTAFAKLFADQGVEGVLSMAATPAAPTPISVAEGAALVDPGTNQEVFRNKGEPKIYSDIAQLKADFDSGFIPREDFVAGRKLLLTNNQPVVAVDDPDSPTGQTFVLRSDAPGEAAPVSSGVTINNTSETAYAKANAKMLVSAIESTVQAGDVAANMLPGLQEAGDLLVAGVSTGRGQELLLPLQQIADDFGLNLNSVAEGLGIAPEEIAKKEEFVRVSTELIINGFSKFKGNLNQKEVEMARAAFANFGRSEMANKMAVASLMASAELAVERRRGALAAGDTEAARAFLSQSASIDTSAFETRRQAKLAELDQRSGVTSGTGAGSQAAGMTEVEASSALPPNTSLGNRSADGRWEVLGDDGSVIGHIEAE